MDDDFDPIRRRLQSLGEVPVDAAVAARHLTSLRAAPRSGVAPRRLAMIGAAAVAFGALSAGIVAADRSNDELVGEPGTAAAAPSDDPACVGPPPFAGEPADGDGGRAAEARAHAEYRATNCPAGVADTTTTSTSVAEATTTTTAATSTTVAAEFSCTGPPPWAGVPAGGDGGRAAQAREFAEFRATQCPEDDADDTTTTTTSTTVVTPTVAAPVPTTVPPTSPPSGEPGGPPAGVPGPPEGVPGGPPAGVPGPPEGVPGGPPAGVPGPPEDVPGGPPENVPGPPDDAPAGPPDDVPAGPPGGAPGGPPADGPGAGRRGP